MLHPQNGLLRVGEVTAVTVAKLVSILPSTHGC